MFGFVEAQEQIRSLDQSSKELLENSQYPHDQQHSQYPTGKTSTGIKIKAPQQPNSDHVLCEQPLINIVTHGGDSIFQGSPPTSSDAK